MTEPALPWGQSPLSVVLCLSWENRHECAINQPVQLYPWPIISHLLAVNQAAVWRRRSRTSVGPEPDVPTAADDQRWRDASSPSPVWSDHFLPNKQGGHGTRGQHDGTSSVWMWGPFPSGHDPRSLPSSGGRSLRHLSAAQSWTRTWKPGNRKCAEALSSGSWFFETKEG